jgi:hypothetical protein
MRMHSGHTKLKKVQPEGALKRVQSEGTLKEAIPFYLMG